MKLVDFLNLNAQKIGSLSWGDCYYSHIFEVWQNLSNGSYYQREIYFSGDDEGYDKAKKISKEEVKFFLDNEDFYKEESISDNLKSFIEANFDKCKGYAEEFFANNILQAAEYLYNQI